jgi:hypothetical protein
MNTPKHERLIERLMDGYWCADNGSRSISDPERMVAVVAVITRELRAQPRSVDCEGCLEWAAYYLETRLAEDTL